MKNTRFFQPFFHHQGSHDIVFVVVKNFLQNILVLLLDPLVVPDHRFRPAGIFRLPVKVDNVIIKGGASACREAGAIVAGGHSIQADEPIYGLAVTGLIDPKELLTNSGARAGDVIVLTKPIGSGVSLLGLKGQCLDRRAESELIDSLTGLNNKGLDIARRCCARAATDVTGFGLAGHLHEMALASGLAATILSDSVPVFTGALALAGQGFVPAAAYSNRKSYERFISYTASLDTALQDLLFDPQTSGGLLLATPAEDGKEMARQLQAAGLTGAVIGYFKAGGAGHLEVA